MAVTGDGREDPGTPTRDTAMRQVLVYDSPTRAFHWLFAGFFITAFAISNLIDDDSARFPLHMLAGLGMAFVVALRIIWSLVGTRHARLGDLALNPMQLVAYFKGMFSGESRRWTGHNPASSWAALAMVVLAIGLATTGTLMATGRDRAQLKELHELMANAFLAVVLLHLGGVIAHVLRHRDRLASSMLTGNKQVPAGEESPVRPMHASGAAFVVLTVLFMGNLLRAYDAHARTLDVFGITLQLGESAEDQEASDSEAHGGEAERD